MADFVFDVARGREVEIYGRVDLNDPANSAFKIVVLALVGLEVDATLRTYQDLATLLAASNNEVTNTGYLRKTLTDADLAVYTVDYSAHLITLPLGGPRKKKRGSKGKERKCSRSRILDLL